MKQKFKEEKGINIPRKRNKYTYSFKCFPLYYSEYVTSPVKKIYKNFNWFHQVLPFKFFD